MRSISATTRLPRSGEKNGREYIFLSPKEFLFRRKTGYFLEWKKVFVNYYGTPLAPVLAHLKKGKSVLLAIDVKGAKTVWQQYPNALKIFIKAPSLKILKERLSGRATEKPQDLQMRLRTARAELREASKYDYVVVNGRVDQALQELERILMQEVPAKQKR